MIRFCITEVRMFSAGGTESEFPRQRAILRPEIMHSLIADIVQGGPALTDGAWGTELQKMGLAPGEMGDLWNLSHPQKVEALAQSYVNAGSKIILTNTFRSNRIALRDHASLAKLKDINRAGVEISRSAAGTR